MLPHSAGCWRQQEALVMRGCATLRKGRKQGGQIASSSPIFMLLAWTWVSGLKPTGLGGTILVSPTEFNLQQEIIYYLEECELIILV